MAFRLETDRLILRDWCKEDIAPFLTHTNTPAVMRWLGGPMGDAETAGLFERFDACRVSHGHCFWLVERKADGGHLGGEILGFCGLKRADLPGGPQGDFEIGWRLREDAWGKGYALEAAQASLDAAFGHFAAPHVVSLTVEGNRPSWGLMERLGMERRKDLDFFLPAQGRFTEDESIIVYRMTQAAWRAGRAAA